MSTSIADVGNIARITPALSGVSLESDSVLNTGIDIMYASLQLLTELSQARYADMSKQITLSRDAQKHASNMSGIIAQMTDPTAKKQPDAAAIQFMDANKIYMTDTAGNPQTITDWLKAQDSTYTASRDKDGKLIFSGNDKDGNPASPLPSLDKSKLTMIQNALSNTADKASDLSSQIQLQIQKLYQTYQASTTMISTLQGMRKDMIMGIIQKSS